MPVQYTLLKCLYSSNASKIGLLERCRLSARPPVNELQSTMPRTTSTLSPSADFQRIMTVGAPQLSLAGIFAKVLMDLDGKQTVRFRCPYCVTGDVVHPIFEFHCAQKRSK